MDTVNLKTKKRQRLSSVLGMTLDGTRLEGVVLRRSGDSLQIQQTFAVTLSLDPLTADAELVGREIRNHLDAAEVRERNCVVGLPLKWALTTHVEAPKLEEADLASFLQLEAERGFPCDVTTLSVCSSRCKLPSGKNFVTLIGIPKNHLERLEQVLTVAKLKPVNFTLGLSALQLPEADATKGILALAVGETHVGLQVTMGGGVAALRVLEGALEQDGGRKVLQADLVAREVRITLGQLPAELRDTVRQVRVFGPRDLGQQLADEIEIRLEAMGLKVEFVGRYASAEGGLQFPADAPVSSSVSLAAGYVAERDTGFEFILPKITRWQQMTARYGSSKLRTAGVLVAAVVLIICGVFGYQQFNLMRLRKEYKGMGAQLKEIKKFEDQIKSFQSWSASTLPSLTILKIVTDSFPDNGTLAAAKNVVIHDLSSVSCVGQCQSFPTLLAIMDRVRTNSGVSDVRQINYQANKTPNQFTFEFRWTPPVAP